MTTPDPSNVPPDQVFRAAWERHRFVPDWPINLPSRDEPDGEAVVIERSHLPTPVEAPVSLLKNMRNGAWLDQQPSRRCRGWCPT